jgi:outer membrane protein assembly factor BamA
VFIDKLVFSTLKNILAFALFGCCLTVSGQQIFLKVVPSEPDGITGKLNYTKKFPNTEAAHKEINNILLSLQYKGYMLAEADTVYQEGNTITAHISHHSQYKSAILKLGNLDPNVASKLGLSEKLYFNKPFRYKEVARSIDKIILFYENMGYPFVSVALDSVTIQNTEINAVLNVTKNKLFRIDSIKVIGSARVNKGFLYRYLSLKEKMPYNENVLAKIPQKVAQLPFVAEQRPQEVRLTDKSNKLMLFLDKKDASQFDGIIGFLPDADTKRTVITGDVKLKLLNGIFHNGETFDLEWRRLQTQTQDFMGRVIYPFIFGSPVGVDYSLKIYRRDTTFIDILNNTGVQYYFNGLNNIKVFYRQRNTNLISTSGLEFVSTLPDYADISTGSYGVGTTIEDLDYRFNPRSGIAINVSAQTGNRTIRQNPKINETAYKDLLLRSTQYQAEGRIDIFIPIVVKNNIIHFGIQAAGISGNSVIFKNELFRIGGFKTLRGFDEESIYASAYVIPTLEYRFLFARNSNLLFFTEGAWYENNSNHRYLSDRPISIGAGINFDTKAGILALNYALGNQFGNGFDLRSGKIHFGLTALF